MILSALAFIAAIVVTREWQDQWFFLALFSIITLSWTVLKPRLGWTATIFLTYCMLSASWVWLFRNNRYIPIEPYAQQAIRMFALDGMMKLWLILAPLLLLAKSKNQFRWTGELASLLFVCLNSGNVIYQAIRQHIEVGGWCSLENTCGGFLGNPSMSISFTVAVLPVAIAQTTSASRILVLLLVAAAAYLSKSSMAVGMIAVALGIYLMLRHKYWLVFMTGLPLVFGYLSMGKTMFSSGLRFEMWNLFMRIWANNPANWPWGMGYGTFGVFSRNIQHSLADPEKGEEVRKLLGLSSAVNPRNDHWWVWLHNDWLQLIFDIGIVGLTLGVATYLVAVNSLWRKKDLSVLASLLLYGILMVFNYPTHVHVSSLFGAWLMLVALLKFTEDQPIYTER